MVSQFAIDCEDLVSELTEEQLSEFLNYTLAFNVSHSSEDELLIGFKSTKGRKKSPVALLVTLPLRYSLHRCLIRSRVHTYAE